jgi:hypothetical protein
MTFRCRRCGDTVQRLTVGQERCQPCDRDVARLIEVDERRRAARTFTAVDTTSRILGRVA